MSSPQPPALPPGASTDALRLDLARAFKAEPIGRHSPALRALLSRLRSGGMTDKYCLLIVEPHRAWSIGRFSGVRGAAPVAADHRVFQSVEEAEWAVFKLRWTEAGVSAFDEDAL